MGFLRCAMGRLLLCFKGTPKCPFRKSVIQTAILQCVMGCLSLGLKGYPQCAPSKSLLCKLHTPVCCGLPGGG